jgi:aerobic carbon-monoxide dehydrogenase medium subunit
MLHFDYVEPTSLEEAVSALSTQEVSGKIIAGGTDVLVRIKEEKLSVDRLVSLSKVPGLRSINDDGAWVTVGAMTTIREVERSDVIRRSAPILFDAVERLGSVQIRNVATLGGNVCNAAPSADTVPALLALNAEVAYWNSGEMKKQHLREFFVGPSKTILEPKDILVSIRFKKPHMRSNGAYLKFSRRQGMDLPLLGIAVQLQMDEGFSRCEDAAIALGVAGPTPMRATEAEKILKGERITEDILARAADEASQEARPRDSFRSTAAYRRDMIRNLLPDVIRRALSRIREGAGKAI